jgi:hypothetical protein
MATSLGSYYKKNDADVVVADGGTGASTDAGARTNLAALGTVAHDALDHRTAGVPGLGKVIQQVRSKAANPIYLVANIPHDGTTPEISEGTEIMTAVITPKSTSNILVFDFSSFGLATGGSIFTIALFQDAINLARAANANGQVYNPLVLRWFENAPSTSAITYRIRAGGNSGGSEIGGRGASQAAYGSGVHATIFTVTEYAPN